RSYRLLGYEPTRFATDGHVAPFVGRAHELDLLRASFDAAAKGHGQIVGIVGDAGTGKSRLFSEFRRRLRGENVTVLEGRCESYASAMPYLPVAGLLRGYFGIEEGEDGARITEKVTARTAALDPGLAAAVPPLLAILDVPVDDPAWRALDAPRRRQRTLEAVRRLLLRVSETQPLVLAIEDLQWVDTDTQAVLDQLVRHLGGAAILLLLNYRPDYRHAWSTVADFRQLRLGPLPAEDAREFLADLLGEEPSLDDLKRLLIERTEGNPFFLEETVWTLAETGVLTGDRGAYELVRPLSDLEVPGSVRAVVAARIARLPVADRTLLQTAAVIGRTVPVAVLQAVTEEPEERVRAALVRLDSGEFLYESTVSSEAAYTFRQALTLEVAYQSILRETRQSLHRKVCRALEHLAGDRFTESLELLAYHAVRGEAWDRATRYVYLAGEHALSHARDRAGVALYEAAVDALDDAEPALRLDAYLDLWSARVAAGAIDGLRELAERTDALARAVGDDARLARLRVRQAQADLTIWPSAGSLERARDLAREAFTLADAADLVTRGEAQYIVAQAGRDLGRCAEAIDDLERGIALLAAGDREARPLHATLCGWRAEALATIGEFESALAAADEGLKAATATGSASAIALAHAFLGYVHLLRSDVETALPILEAGLATAEADDVVHGIAANALYLAYAHALAGDREGALRSLARSLDAGPADAFMTRWTRYRAVTAAVYLAAGRWAEAEAEVALGESLVEAAGARGHTAVLRRLRGDLVMRPEAADLREALHCYEESLDTATDLSMSPAAADAHAGLATLYERSRDRTQAHRHATIAARLRAGMGIRRA
ncbi:MAG TPA: AAA family ATPase, partial [Methylomirabilota bacterium]